MSTRRWVLGSAGVSAGGRAASICGLLPPPGLCSQPADPGTLPSLPHRPAPYAAPAHFTHPQISGSYEAVQKDNAAQRVVVDARVRGALRPRQRATRMRC